MNVDASTGASMRMRVDRRGFVAGAAAGAVGAAAGLGNVMIAQAQTAEQAWDEAYDYVVVGAGSGLLGALRAAKNGERVVVLEKNGFVGGNSACASGDVWIGNNGLGVAEGDSYEKVLSYLRGIQDGSLVEDAVLEAYADGMPKMMEFFSKSCGVEPVARPYGDYYLDVEGSYFAGRTTAFKPAGADDAETLNGAGLIDAMCNACIAAGVELLLSTPVTGLVSRLQENGVPEVLGVVAQGADGPLRIKARKAVMACAGGFEANESMKSCFLRGPMPYTCGVSSNTGDLIQLGMELGADLWQMNEVWFIPTFKERAEERKEMGASAIMMLFERHCPHSMIVNRYGRRFMNEAMNYDVLYRSFYQYNDFGWSTGDFGYANIPAWFIIDSEYVEGGFPLEVARYGEEGATEVPEFFKRADTIEELAELCGIDADGMRETVERFNGFCETGVDEDFGRDADEFSRGWANVCAPGQERSLGTIAKPPFYAAEIAPSNLGTCGGLRVNENSQVVHRTGEPIARLFACGNNTGLGGPGPLYTGGGGTVSQPMTFSIIAADAVHELEPWE